MYEQKMRLEGFEIGEMARIRATGEIVTINSYAFVFGKRNVPVRYGARGTADLFSEDQLEKI